MKGESIKKFTLRVLWLDSNIACSIDHIVNHVQSPLTPYFFWPRNDAWSQIKDELDSKPWISENEKIDILNMVTLIINHWQENKKSKHVNKSKEKFPDIIFYNI